MKSRLVNWGGPACLVGGTIWILIWIAYLLTHGPTMNDMRQTFISLTWYDYSKFVIIPLALFLIGLISLRARQAGRAGRLSLVGFVVASAGFAILIASMLVYWLVPFGSYDPAYRSTDLARVLGIIQFTSPLILGTGLILFGIETMRSHTLRQGNVLPLVTGVAVLVPYLLWTNIGFVFGAAWFAVGLAMVAENRAAP